MSDPTNPGGPEYPAQPPSAPDATGQWNAPTGQWNAPTGQWQQPAGQTGQWQQPADPASSFAAPPADAVDLQPVRSGGNGRKVVAVAAAVALLGAGAFATTQLLGDERGAGSPEEAGEQLIAAINDADVLGVIDLLPEAEQQLLLDITDEYTDEGRRLGLLDDGFTLDGVPGVTIEITDPQLEVDEVREGLAVVSLVDGEASFELDGDEFTGSLGAVADELADATGTEIEVDDVEERTDIGDAVEEAGDFGDLASPFSVAVIEEDGRWFPSIGFTIAEVTRAGLGDGGDAPDLDDGIEAEGAGDPVEAVQALIDAGTDADAEAALGLLDPGELGALQVYSEVFLGDLEAGEETGVTIELEDAEVTDLGDGVNRVLPTAMTASGEVEGGSFEFELADGCITAVTESDDEDVEDLDVEFCAGDDPAEAIPGELGEAFEDLEVPDELSELIEAFQPIEVGIITVERDGQHFVSPIRTIFDLQAALYRGLEREDVEEGGIVFEALTGELDDEFETFFEDLGQRFEEQFETQFEEEFEDFEDDFEDAPIDDPLEDPFEEEEAVPPRTPTGPTGSGPGGELVAGDVVEGFVDIDGEASFTLVGSAGSAFIGAQSLDGEDLTLTVIDPATGEELAFEDDFIGFDPEVLLDLTEGQVVTVVVREFGGDPSAFVVYYEV